MTIDHEWIAEQLHGEAAAIEVNGPPRCFSCTRYGPGLYWLPSEEGIIEMAVWFCGACVVRSYFEDPATRPTHADILRDLLHVWDDLGDDARSWQNRMDALVAQAKELLAPPLVDEDPAPSVRCLP